MQNQEHHTESLIKPAEINLTHSTGNGGREPGRNRNFRTFLTGFLLTCLGVIVFTVIFVLPDWLKTNRPESVDQVPSSPNSASTNNTGIKPAAKNQVSPWSEAQLAKQRKETQEILSEMLDKQDLLVEKEVTEWANEDYQKALQLAESGDAMYRQRDFIQAKDKYQQGLAEFNRLLEHSETVFNGAIEKGYSAIESGDSEAAAQSFQLALLIKPEDNTAVRGNERVQTLEQVMQLLSQADVLLETGQLEEARDIYRQILDIDADTTRASDMLAQTRARIIDRDFTNAMSEGFNSLENEQFEKARRAFQTALKIRPSSSEARSALRQTENRITVININNILAKAQQLETSEKWPEAAEEFGKALDLDPNLATAQQGKQYALARSNLDNQLTYAIQNPMRLSNEAVYNEVSALVRQAKSIQSPGNKLEQQINVLETILSNARTPVSVTFQSNSLTDVTIYRVGQLGQFQSKNLSLVPGRYVAVGKRGGFKDVRIEFTVDPNKPISTVIVQCEEEISF